MKNKPAQVKRKPMPPRRRRKAKRVVRAPQTPTLATSPSVADDRLLSLSRAVEQSPVSIMITDALGNIEYVNPKFCQLTGYTSAEVIGKNPRILKSGEKSPEEYREMWNTLLAGQEWHGEFHNRKKNGELYWEAASLSPIIDQGKTTHFLAIKEDITERKRIEAALTTHVLHLGLLNEITRAGLTATGLHLMLHQIADRFVELLAADRCFVTLWDEQHKRDFPAAASGSLHESYSSMVITTSEPRLTQVALAEGQPLAIENVGESPYRHHPIMERFPTTSILCLPVMDSGRKLGALLIAYARPHRFPPDEINLGVQAAALVALAIVKTQSFAAEQQRAAELEALRQASLMLTSSLDLPAVLDAILESTMALTTDARDAHIYLYDQGKLTFGSSHWKDGRKGQEWSPPRENGLTNTVARTGETMVVPNMRDHPLFEEAPSSWQGAIIGLPLKISERVVGVMSIAFDTSRAFVENELRVLRLFATQAAIAIENARLYVQVQQLAVTDPLTGLFNRRGFYQIGAIEFDRAWRFDRPLSAIMLDIDHFKPINDMFTHAVGDKVLVELAEACRRSLRAVDVVGRYGGEEFVILLPEASPGVAARIAERLRATVQEIRVPANGDQVSITISIGVATMSRETSDLNLLVERADQALYRAKEAGRNNVIAFDETP